jgi:hypothetical protein
MSRKNRQKLQILRDKGYLDFLGKGTYRLATAIRGWFPRLYGGHMAWFSNHYRCARCDGEWTDEWSCMCDDDCPYCGARHMSPSHSDDLTKIIERKADCFVVCWSPASADDDPNYQQVAAFPTLKLAEAYISDGEGVARVGEDWKCRRSGTWPTA